MGKNQNTWSHSTKIIFHPSEASRVSPPELSFFAGKRQRHWQRITCRRPLQFVVCVVFECLRQRSNGLKICLPAYFTCMCFLGFIRYNKTFIACGFRKYENVFTHEYHIPLGCCPQGIWYSWVNKFSYFPHQHAINV